MRGVAGRAKRSIDVGTSGAEISLCVEKEVISQTTPAHLRISADAWHAIRGEVGPDSDVG